MKKTMIALFILLKSINLLANPFDIYDYKTINRDLFESKGLHIKVDNRLEINRSTVKEEIKHESETDRTYPWGTIVYNFQRLSIFFSYKSISLYENREFKDGAPFYSKIEENVFNLIAPTNPMITQSTDEAELRTSNFKTESKGYDITSGLAYKPIDRLRLSLGAKYFYNDLNYSGNATYNFLSPSGIPDVPAIVHRQSFSLNYSSDITTIGFIFGVDYKFRDLFNLEFIYNRYNSLNYKSTTNYNGLPVNILPEKISTLPDRLSLSLLSSRFYGLTAGVNISYLYNSEDAALVAGVDINYQLKNLSEINLSYTYKKLSDGKATYISHQSSSTTLGVGLKTYLTENLKLNLNSRLVTYDDIKTDNYNAGKIETYTKESFIISAGLEWSLLND